MHPLLTHIKRHIDLSIEEFEHVLTVFQMINKPKKAILVEEGQRVSHQYFVLKGCLRTYMLDHSGKEHTIQFAVENWWASDYIAYYKEVPSTLYVECLEDCQLLKVSKEDLIKLFKSHPLLEKFFRIQLENAFVAFQRRILSNLQMTAGERYLAFLHRYPNIEQRVKNYHIASYLGITSESLSRLRKMRGNK